MDNINMYEKLGSENMGERLVNACPLLLLLLHSSTLWRDATLTQKMTSQFAVGINQDCLFQCSLLYFSAWDVVWNFRETLNNENKYLYFAY